MIVSHIYLLVLTDAGLVDGKGRKGKAGKKSAGTILKVLFELGFFSSTALPILASCLEVIHLRKQESSLAAFIPSFNP
ncbi:hypothetical protein TcWFU_005497 [Taenia crassiceps]|uniref:Uncharacterized protein n=1 Tax=Taenia crassiceps TaxID=6207 RepID=A0ABR4QR41_9CEST